MVFKPWNGLPPKWQVPVYWMFTYVGLLEKYYSHTKEFG